MTNFLAPLSVVTYRSNAVYLGGDKVTGVLITGQEIIYTIDNKEQYKVIDREVEVVHGEVGITGYALNFNEDGEASWELCQLSLLFCVERRLCEADLS